MQITEVHIRKYRAFDRQIKVPLSPFTVLTGPNNLGKSTVLRALDLFFSVFARGEIPKFILARQYKASADYPKGYKRGRKWPTRIEVSLDFSADDKTNASLAIGIALPDHCSICLELRPRGVSASEVKVTSPQFPADEAIAAFAAWFATSASYVYIPATRAIGRFRQSVFSELVESAIFSLSRSKQRVEQVQRFYSDVSKRLGTVESDLTTELQPYLPDVKKVRLVLTPLDLLKLVDVSDVQIDDGALTSLDQKGDGFKSVFAMSVLQYIAKQRSGRNITFAIEEPESHLHSSAIYEVKSSLEALSKSFQTLITTHSPVLIQRERLTANVIIGRAAGPNFSSSASAAKTLGQIRESLGIRAQDNMTSAEVVALVEGATEETCLGALLTRLSPETGAALANGRARIISAGGAAKMTAVMRALARDVISCVAITDADQAGEKARIDLLASGLINSADVFGLPTRPGCKETEFEDSFPVDLWINEVAAACGIVCSESDYLTAQQHSGSTGDKAQKWSRVMASVCSQNGKAWVDVQGAAKSAFAAALVAKATVLKASDYPWIRSLAGQIKNHLAGV